MAKYGLGQADLNKRAQLAMMGLSDAPAIDIQALLKSSQPIEPNTRALLAELFGGRTSGLEIKAIKKKPLDVYRRLRERLVMVRAAEESVSLKRRMKASDAQEQTAAKYGCSPKHIEGFETLRKKAKAWAKRRMRHSNNPPGITEWHLQVAYLYAVTTKRRPSDVVKPSLPLLCQLLEEKDQDHASGFSFQDSPKSKIRIR